jgi:hypothetical protein
VLERAVVARRLGPPGFRAVVLRAGERRAVVRFAVVALRFGPDALRRVPERLLPPDTAFSASLASLRAVFNHDALPLRRFAGSFLICFSMLSSVVPWLFLLGRRAVVRRAPADDVRLAAVLRVVPRPLAFAVVRRVVVVRRLAVLRAAGDITLLSLWGTVRMFISYAGWQRKANGEDTPSHIRARNDASSTKHGRCELAVEA